MRLMRMFTGVINDDINLALEIEEMQLAEMKEKLSEFQPGGSSMSVNAAGLGIQPLAVPVKLAGYNPNVAGFFGGPPGLRHNFTGKVFRVDEYSGEEGEHMVDLKGRLTELKGSSLKGGDLDKYDHVWDSITEYSESFNGKVLHRFKLQMGGWIVWRGEPINANGRSFIHS